MRCFSVVVVGCLLASRAALAAPPSGGPVLVTATASTEEKDFPAIAAAAPDWRRDRKPDGWCAASMAGATLTLAFDHAVSLDEIELHSGYSEKKPAKVQVTTDKGTFDGALSSGTPWGRVKLDPAPTKKLVIKIVTVEGGPRACVHKLYVRTNNWSLPLIPGMTPAQLAALRTTLHQANTALEACDPAGIAATIAFPIEVTTSFAEDDERDPMGPPGKQPIVKKYASADQLVAACKKEGSVLALGYQGEGYGLTLDADWDVGRLKSLARDEVQLDGRWTALLKGDTWKVTALEYSDPPTELDQLTSPLQQWFAGWLLVEKKEVFTPDAKVVLLHARYATAQPHEAFGIVSISPDDKLGPATVDEQTLSRDGEAMWMTVVRKVAGKELRGTAFALPGPAGWQIQTALVTWARANADVNKAAAAGTSPAFTPLPALVGDKALLDAVKALTSGGLDAIAAARKDLIALGSGPGEKTVGGAKLVKPWKAAWAGKLETTGGLVTMSRTGTSAFVVLDAKLDKGKYKIPFRIGLVFDRAGTGAWTLAHVHFATP
jgi:hypothetical protein